MNFFLVFCWVKNHVIPGKYFYFKRLFIEVLAYLIKFIKLNLYFEEGIQISH